MEGQGIDSLAPFFMRRINTKGKVLRVLLLSVAMFIAGYLTAVCTLEHSAVQGERPESANDYKDKLSGVTSQIKDMVKEHGSKAYTEISEYLKSLQSDKDKKAEDED